MDIRRAKEIAEQQMAARKEQSAREPGWLFHHGMRTGKIALRLAQILKANVDKNVLFAGSLFHDIGKGTDPHNLTGSRLATELLAEVCAPEELVQICEIVELHNQRHESKNHPMSARIVQDADLIDHVGLIVPWLAFYWCGAHNETIDDHIGFVCGEQNEKYRKGMRSRLNFDVSIEIFDERVRWEDEFFTTFREVYFEGVWGNDGAH